MIEMEGKRVSQIFVILALLVANIWLVQKALSSSGVRPPRLELGILEGASLLTKDSATLPITWQRPHNILVLGKTGGEHIAPDLTDTIMIVSINPSGRARVPSVKLISIPRDLLLRASNTSSGEILFRVNALWSYAQQDENPVNYLKTAIGELAGITIDSLVLFDLETARKIAEKVGGVTVFVAEDIRDERFPAEGGGYETFALARGWRYLGAAEAMRFARTRASARGDFERIERQQEFLRSLKGKITSLNPLWNFPTLWSIFNLVKNEVVTDLGEDDLKNIWAASERVSFGDIETMSIDERAGIAPKRVGLGGQAADVLVASGGNPFDYSGVREAVARFIAK